MNNNTLLKQPQENQGLVFALNAMAMFAERYISEETPSSAKMNLELTTSWNCSPVLY